MQVKNREWVKNAAIIFLAIMLVLTFFSSTIMNYSLPEVAGQVANSGSIKTAVRGTGTVAANQSFNVELEETRQIAKIHVKTGAAVEAGQLLFTLEEGRSDELEAAVKALRDLENALNRKLLQMQPADYDDQNRQIARLQEALKELNDKRAKADGYTGLIQQAKEAVKAAQARVDALEKQQAGLEANIADLSSQDDYDYKHLMTDTLTQLKEALNKALEAQAQAQQAVDQAQADVESSGGSGGNASAIMQSITAKQDQIAALLVGQENQKHTALAAIAPVPDVSAELAAYNADPTDATLKTLFQAVKSKASGSEAAKAVDKYYTFNDELLLARTQLQNLEVDYDNATSGAGTAAQNRLKTAKERLAKAKLAAENAQKAFDRALKELTREYQEKLRAKKIEVKEAQEALTEARAALTEAESESGGKPEELDAQIKAKQREIEDALSALAKKRKEDKVAEAINQLDLAADRAAIKTQEAQVERLRERAGGTEVKARYGGLVTAVNCVAGEKVQAGSPLAAIDVEGKGYTTKISVTNEQAQRIRVGDSTTINNWRENIYLEVTAIRIDPESQGRKRIIEMLVEGETLSAGRQLDISIGEKDQYYDVLLPNSAVREDADGSFILVAEVKNTPLGNRYTATRIAVNVLAKDEVNSAISRDNYNYEFVITTATKPVEPGTQVRLVD